jgi:hypothetical protein
VYFVASPKEKMINVRLEPSIHEDFKIACSLRGVSMSSLLHQFIFRVIREEKEIAPRAFARSEIEPTRGQRIAHVRHLGELTDETKAIKKKAGRK